MRKEAYGVDEILAQALLGLKISDPVSHGLLHIFPLRGDTSAEGDISLLEDGLRTGTLRIEELDEAGSVPGLRVVNEGTSRVLILEGDELIGARQNRVANSSVLVDAGSELILPHWCVEHGRWGYRSRAFSSENDGPHPALRRLATRSVHDSLGGGRAHRSDQRGVWREIDRMARLYRAALLTHAPQDSQSHLSERLDAFGKLARELPEGTSGVVVAIGERLVLLEVLAGPCTFARAFRKLLSGYALESIGLDRPYGTPDTQAVRSFIEEAAKAALEEHQTVGAGRDVMFEGDGLSGYALIAERGLLHAAFAG